MAEGLNETDVAYIIGNINQEIYNVLGDEDDVFQLQMGSNSYVMIVMFLGCQIWNSDDDERIFYEEANEFEPLHDFLVREMKKKVAMLEKLEVLK